MKQRRKQVFADALAAGLIGYAVVVVFFAILNVVGGRSPFFTAAVMGEALFGGLRDASAASLAPGPILAFNGVHLVAFLAFGLLASWLVYEAELHPGFWYLTVFVFTGAVVLGYAGVLAVTVLLGGVLSPWLVVAASLLGAAGVVGYLERVHRPLFRSLWGGAESGLGRVE